MTDKMRLHLLVEQWERVYDDTANQGIDIVDIGYTIEHLKRLQGLENVIEHCAAVLSHIEAFEKLSDKSWELLDTLFKLPAMKELEPKHRLKRFEDMTKPDPRE